jgi:hypothetical protein
MNGSPLSDERQEQLGCINWSDVDILWINIFGVKKVEVSGCWADRRGG